MSRAAGPKNGVTVRAHVERSMSNATTVLIDVEAEILEANRLGPAMRDALRRKLAGVISDCESVRLWLDAGCPEG